MKKFKDNSLTRQLTYKTVMGILPIFVRFSDSTGISDVHELNDYIQSLTMEDFLNYKFNDNNIVEGDS